MPHYSVSKVDAPWQRSGLSVGVISESGKEASDPAYGDADADWYRENISGSSLDPHDVFHYFDC